jgi:hypothetical protein
MDLKSNIEKEIQVTLTISQDSNLHLNFKINGATNWIGD